MIFLYLLLTALTLACVAQATTSVLSYRAINRRERRTVTSYELLGQQAAQKMLDKIEET